MSLEGLAKGGLGSTTVPTSELPSATLSSGRLVRIDEQPLVGQLLEHLKTQSGKGKGLEEAHAARLRTLLAGNGAAADNPQPGAGRQYDAAIVIAVPEQATPTASPTGRRASSTKGPIVLVAAGLLKGPNDQLFIQHAEAVPDDPGFTAKQAFRVIYDVESARWHLFRGSEPKTLAPKACEAVSDIFVDVAGRSCEAFYTGPLVSKGTVSR